MNNRVVFLFKKEEKTYINMVRFIAECLLQKVRKVRIDTSEPLNKANEKIVVV